MRQLTDSERQARDVAKSRSDVPHLIDDHEHYIFDLAFTACLDHSSAQIAALTAENERMRGKLIDLYTGEYIVLNQLSMALFGKQIDSEIQKEIHRLMQAHWDAKKAQVKK